MCGIICRSTTVKVLLQLIVVDLEQCLRDVGGDIEHSLFSRVLSISLGDLPSHKLKPSIFQDQLAFIEFKANVLGVRSRVKMFRLIQITGRECCCYEVVSVDMACGRGCRRLPGRTMIFSRDLEITFADQNINNFILTACCSFRIPSITLRQ